MKPFVRKVGLLLWAGPILALAGCAPLSGASGAVAGSGDQARAPVRLALPGFLRSGPVDPEEEARAIEGRIDALYTEIDTLRGDLARLRGETGSRAEQAPSLYAEAPVLPGSVSLYFEAEVGEYPSRHAAEGDWERLAREPALAGYNPRYHLSGEAVRLSVGPLTSEREVESLCRVMAAIAPTCRLASPEIGWRRNG